MYRKLGSVISVTILYSVILMILFSGVNDSVTVMSDNNGTDIGINMPVIMYHSILRDESRSGEYVITPQQLDSDIKYLYSQGFTTVSAAQVIDYAENGEPLPEKPVMLTFDDGCYNNLFYAVPILKDNNARGIFSIVGEYTDEYTASGEVNPNYSYLRWEDVYEMYLSENCEIANHSYGFHSRSAKRNGSKKRSGESAEEYKKIFAEDTRRMQDACFENCGFYPVIYAYPYGLYSEESFEVLKEMGFKMTLSCEEGMNRITRGTDCLNLLKRYNRPAGVSSEKFFEKIAE